MGIPQAEPILNEYFKDAHGWLVLDILMEPKVLFSYQPIHVPARNSWNLNKNQILVPIINDIAKTAIDDTIAMMPKIIPKPRNQPGIFS